jgi:hypothetical protein
MKKWTCCWLGVLGFSWAFAAELFDQLSDPGPYGSVSCFAQTPQVNIQAADDFTVPQGQVWSLQALSFLGGHVDCRTKDPFSPFPVNVFLYEDGDGLPGSLLASFMALAPFLYEDAWSVNLGLSLPLPAGTYWVVFQWAAGDQACHLGVRTRQGQRGNPYAWKTGGDLPGILGCSTWGVGMLCNDAAYDPNVHPDLAFALFDEPLVAPSSVPLLDGNGVGFLTGFLLILGLIMRAARR